MNNDELREQARQIGVEQNELLLSDSWWHSIDLGNGLVTAGVNSLAELQGIYQSLELPEDLSRKTLLDIGCWDGFYTFETERRGAKVTSIDCWHPNNFFAARQALNSKAEFHERSVYELGKDSLGSFDIVLFMGVLHHLRHPLLAMENVCELTRDFAVIDSRITDKTREGGEPAMEFYEFDELGGQYDNWWAPNLECMVQMARSAGFARVELLFQRETRAAVKAYRKWNDKPEIASPSLRILDVTNPTTFDHNFPRRGRSSSLSILADGLSANARRWEVRVDVGGYGIHPAYVGPPGDPQYSSLTQINTPIPPGLEPGKTSVCFWHDGRLSNEFEIQLADAGRW